MKSGRRRIFAWCGRSITPLSAMMILAPLRTRTKPARLGAQGCQPRALRPVPVGRGRGIAPDVRRHPVDGRPAAGTACASMSGQRDQSRRGSEERYASVRAEQRGWALPCRHRRLRSPVADAGRDLPLPKPFKGAILASKRRASGECRINNPRGKCIGEGIWMPP